MLTSALLLACGAHTLAQALPAGALPTGWNVTSGSAAITQNGNTLNINQTSQQAIANFASFNVGSGALVDIRQINSSAALLARVTGGDPSQIQGQIRADGALWLINQAGIMVGPGARIDVARFIASSLNVSDSDFLAGRMNFKGIGTPGDVRNEGVVNAASGGSIYLVGANVTNSGSLNAPQGKVLLAAGQTVQLVDTATPGVSVAITGTPGEVRNMGRITAEAGRIGLAAGLVSNSGTINASSAVREGGRIFLRASGDIKTSATSNISANGTTGGNVVLIAENAASIDGDVSATGSVGRGGYVDTSGHRSLDVVKAPAVGQGGEWHIDPFNIEIVASGPNFGVTGENVITSNETGAHISASTITNALDNGINVTITTGRGNPALDLAHGDITVSSAISKTAGADAALTLRANNNIIINAPITSTSNKLDLTLNSNYQSDYPADDHAVQLNANLALNGGLLRVSQSEGNGNGTLNIAGGTTTLVTGSIINAAAVNVLAGGTLSGNGTLTGALSNNGNVTVGGSGAIGRLTVQGNYAQGSSGGLNVELQATDGFDQLAVTGTASLNGRLSIRAVNGFVPPLDTTFNVVTAQAAGSSGSFSTIDAPQQSTAAFAASLPISYPSAGTTRITVLPPIPSPVPGSAASTTTSTTPPLPPTADICTIAPNSALCQVLSPPTASEPVRPIQQATNSIIKTVTASKPMALPQQQSSTPEEVAAMPAFIPAAGSSSSGGGNSGGGTTSSGSSGPAATSTTPDENTAKSDDKKDEKAVASKETVAKNEPAKKTFCN
ncbi:filamentous hemagglutinin N-terminal domain-containing protein [Polaromonas sp. YR568]|uniref:two-partner secretion domain-containing protein n=1 Tax=Polaromonas sp. YR568 TaxID=1855301 RepID=UPI001587F1E4|nr:filamentous hemagglutinin N-terminal domain-containing protein [Polaromonas sp. YR568]